MSERAIGILTFLAASMASICLTGGGGRTMAQEKGDAMRPVAEVEGVSEYVLDNGARVLLYPDASASSVTVNMTVLVGSRHEGYGESGMAHLLEHLLFKGTPLHPDVPKVLQDRGANFNGTTWLDRTNYYETLAGRRRQSGIRHSLGGGSPGQQLCPRRRSAIRDDRGPERIRTRREFAAASLMQRIQSAAFEWHNYGKSTIGNRSDIERVPITNLRDFYRRHYQPDNIVLIIGGKFEPSEALALVNKYFGILPKPERARI